MTSSAAVPTSESRYVPEKFEGELEPNWYCRHWNPRRQKYCRNRAGAGTDHRGVGRCKFGGGSTPIRHGLYSVITREPIAALIRHFEENQTRDTFPELNASRALFVHWIQRYDEYVEALLAWHASYAEGMRPIPDELVQALQDVIDELEAHVGPAPEPPPVRMEPEHQAHGGWLRRDRAEEVEGERIHQSIRLARRLIESLRTAPDLKPRKVMDIAVGKQLLDTITQTVERMDKRDSANHISRKDFLRVMTEFALVVDRLVDDEDTKEAIRQGWAGVRLG